MGNGIGPQEPGNIVIWHTLCSFRADKRPLTSSIVPTRAPKWRATFLHVRVSVLKRVKKVGQSSCRHTRSTLSHYYRLHRLFSEQSCESVLGSLFIMLTCCFFFPLERWFICVLNLVVRWCGSVCSPFLSFFFFVYFAQEEWNQMLRSHLVNAVLTRELQYSVSEEKRCGGFWRRALLVDNQLKIKVVVLNYSNPCESFHYETFVLDIIDYIHIYIFTLDFSHEI